VGNDSAVDGWITVGALGGLLHTGRNAFFTDGSTVTADQVVLGPSTDAWAAATNGLVLHPHAAVRAGETAAPPLPLDLECPIPAFDCGGDDVVVLPDADVEPLAPGTYGTLILRNGTTLQLLPGTYGVCALEIGRQARLITDGVTTLNVSSSVSVGGGAYVGPLDDGFQRPTLNVAGTRVHVSQDARHALQDVEARELVVRALSGRTAHSAPLPPSFMP
jgi:hypothetical protein